MSKTKKKAVKKVEKKVARNAGNRYLTEENGKGYTFTAIKKLANGKERTDVVKLSAADISKMKAELKKGDKGSFDKLVIELVTKPCKLDSKAKKEGLTANTGYCPVNADMREICS